MNADKTVMKHIFTLDGGHTITMTNGTVVTFEYMTCDTGNGSKPMSVDISKTNLGKILLGELEREKL